MLDQAHFSEGADPTDAVAAPRMAARDQILTNGGAGVVREVAVDLGDFLAQAIKIGAVPGVKRASEARLDMIRQAPRENGGDDVLLRVI